MMAHASLCFSNVRFTNEASAFKTLIPTLAYFPSFIWENAYGIIMSKSLLA
jgi:hypothetical protein